MPSSSPPLDDLHSRPGFLFKRCHQVAVAVFLAECGGFRITPSQYGCLQALKACPDVDQLTLGRLVGLDRSTVGLVVKILSRRGLIARGVHPRDKRKLSLRLSASGVRLLKAIAPAAARVPDKVLGALPRASRGRFIALLQEFLRCHEAAIDVAGILAASDSETDEQPATLRPGKGRAAKSRPRRR